MQKMVLVKKTFIILPFELLATKEIVDKLKKQFPYLFDTNQIHFANFIDDDLKFISKGDTVIIEDDTDYTITALEKICDKTKNPVIVLKKDNENTFVKILVSRIK